MGLTFLEKHPNVAIRRIQNEAERAYRRSQRGQPALLTENTAKRTISAGKALEFAGLVGSGLGGLGALKYVASKTTAYGAGKAFGGLIGGLTKTGLRAAAHLGYSTSKMAAGSVVGATKSLLPTSAISSVGSSIKGAIAGGLPYAGITGLYGAAMYPTWTAQQKTYDSVQAWKKFQATRSKTAQSLGGGKMANRQVFDPFQIVQGIQGLAQEQFTRSPRKRSKTAHVKACIKKKLLGRACYKAKNGNLGGAVKDYRKALRFGRSYC